MNIEVQCCGIAILLLLWIFYLKNKPLGLDSVKLFLITMGITSFCVIMDIVSIVAITYREQIPAFLLALICKTYIVSLVWVGYFGLLYSGTDFTDEQHRRKKLNELYTVLVVAGTILIYALPIHYYLDGREVYTYGPSCLATYAFALIFILITLYQVTVRGKEMNAKRRNAVITWMAIWIIAAFVQFINAKLLLVGFASVLGMVILFFELENPEANLDRETSAYNAHALSEYMRQFYERKESFSSILLAFTDMGKHRDDDGGEAHWEALMPEMVRYLEKIRDVKVFKTPERELILMIPGEERMQQIFLMLQERFENSWYDKVHERSVVLHPYYVLLGDSSIIRDENEIFQMLRYFRIEGKKSEKHIMILDEKKIETLREQDRTEDMILSALEEDRIAVFYQPIYSTHSKKFVSAEALVRILDKDGSVIPPGKFVPIAEKTGLITRIGETVFEKTCAFISKNNLKERYGIEYVEVNLSVKQCEKRKLAQTFIGIMQKYNVQPDCINLEITESAPIQTRHIFLENVQTLLDYGVTFSLDDFGSGESNLNYIVEMPVSIVKFDRGMTQAYFADFRARFVMEAAMRMIQEMELKIVSEGVETKEQMETIVALGIDYIQGYYFSKPLQGEAFLRFVEKWENTSL
ncbi:MAG: EAL domain-containing protein [Bacillus sp. (in: Bacteria)]|nr:EAL domain-containing protein [Bacillus sp. (in: firmicutes)]MCM1427409.1 EAL domain-containing protein [Eubacterium sp.]